MIPSIYSVVNFVEADAQPSRTYRINFKEQRIEGFIDDDAEAIKQMIYCRLMTERGQYAIYSKGYGVTTSQYIGKDIRLVYAYIKDAVESTLLQDDRITGVSDFGFTEAGKRIINVSFTAETNLGKAITTEVTLNV